MEAINGPSLRSMAEINKTFTMIKKKQNYNIDSIYKKPLPPYGDLLEKLINYTNLSNSIFIFCGKHGWKNAKSSLTNCIISTCLPPGKSFQDYRWPVKNTQIILSDTGGMLLKDLHLFVLHLIMKEDAKSIILDSIQHLPFPHIQIFSANELNSERKSQ